MSLSVVKRLSALLGSFWSVYRRTLDAYLILFSISGHTKKKSGCVTNALSVSAWTSPIQARKCATFESRCQISTKWRQILNTLCDMFADCAVKCSCWKCRCRHISKLSMKKATTGLAMLVAREWTLNPGYPSTFSGTVLNEANLFISRIRSKAAIYFSAQADFQFIWDIKYNSPL